MTVDLSTVPLVAVSGASKQAVANKLNSLKVLPSDNGLPRDWRGLAHLLGLSAEDESLLITKLDPTMHMWTMLEKSKKDITIKNFQTMMEQMDRWDVIDDTEALFQTDAERYLEHQQRAQVSADPIDERTDQKILTIGDIHRVRQGLNTQYYDAFVLYAEEDTDFADVMVEKLEKEFMLKLCLKDRDLVAGEFEHEAVMRIISDRCNRLVIIVSPNFLQSSANKFFLNYTQALSIDKQQRKIVPCIYKNCELPTQLRYIYHLKYNHIKLQAFWRQLRYSILTPNSIATSSSTEVENSITIQETTRVEEILSDDVVPRIIVNKILNEQNSQRTENHETENTVEANDIKTSNVNNSKNSEKNKIKMKLLWEKITSKKKVKQNNQSIAETIVRNLPSIDNLDLPSIDSLDSLDTRVYKTKKKNFLSKFTKEKVAIKA